jgi:hypothetical protein
MIPPRYAQNFILVARHPQPIGEFLLFGGRVFTLPLADWPNPALTLQLG